MTIKFIEITLHIAIAVLVLLLIIIPVCAQHYPIWPIRPEDDPQAWDRVNSTFGESRGDHFHGGENGHAAAFIKLHPGHVFGGLEGEPAGVEGDGFADEYNRFGF